MPKPFFHYLVSLLDIVIFHLGRALIEDTLENGSLFHVERVHQRHIPLPFSLLNHGLARQDERDDIDRTWVLQTLTKSHPVHFFMSAQGSRPRDVSNAIWR